MLFVEFILPLRCKVNNKSSNSKIMKERIKRFIDFYRSQEIGRRREIRDEFLRRSGLSYPSWGSKLTRENYTLLEIGALEDICGLSRA